MTLESRNKSYFTKPKISFAIISILLVVFAFLATTEATAKMFGLFKKHDVHLSPAVSGKLSKGDTPLKGIAVTRSLTYDNEQIDTAVTDEQGQFSPLLVQHREVPIAHCTKLASDKSLA